MCFRAKRCFGQATWGFLANDAQQHAPLGRAHERRAMHKSVGARRWAWTLRRTGRDRLLSDTVEVPIERLGLGGMHGELVVVDGFGNETRSDEERLKDQSAREFVVRALLAKNPEPVGPVPCRSCITLGRRPTIGGTDGAKAALPIITTSRARR